MRRAPAFMKDDLMFSDKPAGQVYRCEWHKVWPRFGVAGRGPGSLIHCARLWGSNLTPPVDWDTGIFLCSELCENFIFYIILEMQNTHTIQRNKWSVMGVPLETWRERIGGWRGGRPAKKPSKDPSPCFEVMKRLPRGHLVLVTLCVTLATLSLSARSADIALRLSHDIEKNPGPSSHYHGVR